jgi:two-component system NtrC family sensor kinase
MDLNVSEHKQYYRHLMINMLFTVVIVSFLPMIFVGGIILYQFQNSYSEKVIANLENLVNRHRQDIDTFLNERRGDIRFLGASYTFDQLSDEFFLQKQLAILQEEYKNVFSDLGVVDHEGKQVTYAGPYKLEKADYSGAEWFKKAITSQTFISDVLLGLRGFPHFIVTVRNFNNGKPWILRAAVDFQAFNNLVQGIRIGKTGMAFIVNQKGEHQTQTPKNILNAIRLFDVVRVSEAAGPDIHIEEHMDADTQKDLIYVVGYLKNREWALIYVQDKEDAYSDLKRAQWLAFAVFIAGGLIILTMAIVVSRNMVGRIKDAENQKEMMNQQVIETGRLASLGELAAGIAHEINNPVAIMVEEAGWIGDILADGEFQESENLSEFKRALTQIKTQGLRCRDITQKLLSFARRSDSEHQVFQINEMLEEVINLFSNQAKLQNVVLEARYGKELPYIRASKTEIQQVLFNLIINAMDAMKNTGGKIILSTGYQDDMILIEVKDNGPGIPRTALPRIFDPFYTTKPVGKGTGLGLSICFGILNKMGGKITVSSAVGVGTTFQVLIPDLEGREEQAGHETTEYNNIDKGGAI